MIRRSRLIFFLAFALAAEAPNPAELIRSRDIKAQITFLAAESMAGRNAGSAEGRIAADYIASEFERLGLKPVGDGATYFQNFDLVQFNLDNAQMGLSARIGDAEKNFQFKHDFAWVRQGANSAKVSGPLVFVGYGVNAPEYGYNDFAGVDVRGKIVMAMNWEPRQFDPKSKFKGAWNTVHAYSHYKMEQVRRAGAAGLLMVRDRKPVRPPRLASGPTNMQAGTAAEISLAGDFWDLPTYSISADLADELLHSSGTTVEALQKEIDASLQPHSMVVPGITVTMDKALKDRRVIATRNVVGLLEGSDPSLKDEVVVVTGHYDHMGVVGNRMYRGADDNASGTVGVMQIAKAYVQGGVRPKRSVLFVVFEAEEEGLLGAAYYVRHPIFPLKNTAANLNMDMIGRDEDSPTWKTPADQNRNSVNVVGTLYNPALAKTIERSNREIGLKLDYKTDARDPESWFARSDHFPFAIEGVPMVLFNTGEHPDYHTEQDTPERINYSKMEKIVRLIFLTSLDVANAAERIPFVR